MNLYLPEQLLALHDRLDKDGIPHAFGGAIALAYYGQPRATYDIDVNIFLQTTQYGRVLDSLATLFLVSDRVRHEREILQTAQARLRWGAIPVDLFFSEIPFHDSVATRARQVDFAGTRISILSAEDLIICKAAYNRPKDWVDIENIFRVQQERLDIAYLRRWFDEFFQPEDEQCVKIEAYIRDYGSGAGIERP